MEIKPKIIIVDDDPQELENMSWQLQEIADVMVATNGEDAIKCVRECKPDLMLLDVKMPGMDGFRVLEELREIEAIEVPVIMVTSSSEKDTVLNSVIMGIDAYLIKPVSGDVLRKKVLDVYRERYGDTAKKNTILMIDDDVTYLKQISHLLKDDYDVVMINSAKLALEYLKNNVPDVIVLDYQMPEYNGASMMGLIHEANPNRQIPMIVLSGVLNKDKVQECYMYNPIACIEKPVKKEVLEEKIRQALYS